ncbi:MAG: glycosyltransferase family 2 protein [Ilumatobacteraceae bacterium]
MPTTAALVSVVTAVHVRDVGYLAGALESISAQTLVDWEWLVQGDGVDDELSWLEALDPRIKVDRSAAAFGPARARNAAVGRGTAPFIRNLDADDLLASPTVLERTVAVLSEPTVGFVVGPVVDLLVDGTQRPFDDVLRAGRIPAGTLYPTWEAMGRVLPVHPTAVTMRRDMFDRFGGYPDVPHGEDTALLLPASQVVDGWFADFPLALHRKRPDSMTGRLDEAGRRQLDLTRDETARRAREIAVGEPGSPA